MIKLRLLLAFSFVLLLLSSNSTKAYQFYSKTVDSTYLNETVELLQQKWPKNRTINIVFHGHSVPSGYLNTPTITTFRAYPMLGSGFDKSSLQDKANKVDFPPQLLGSVPQWNWSNKYQ
jgi:hypothetical protein